YKDEFIDAQLDIGEEVLVELPEELTRESINTVLRKDGESQLVYKMSQEVKKYEEKLKKGELKEKPLKQLRKSLEMLEGINPDIVPKMSLEHLEEMESLLNEMEQAVEGLREIVNAE
ncbi:hypothetical protein, partial [Thomasclavelia ramosa]